MGEERALAPTPSTEKRQQAPTTAPANARQKAPAKGVITEKPVVSTQTMVPLPAALEKAKALKDAQIRTYPQDYANRHAANILDAIETRIRSVEPQQPHPRLRWASRGDAHRTIHLAIRRYVNVVPDLVLKRLMELSYPADLYKITEDALVSPGAPRSRSVRRRATSMRRRSISRAVAARLECRTRPSSPRRTARR